MSVRRSGLALCAVLLLGAAGPVRSTPPSPNSNPNSNPVTLQSSPGTKADATARSLSADDIAAAQARGDRPLVLVARAALGGPQPALFVQLQSPQECGSAGCSTSVYSVEHGRWLRVLDSATGAIRVSAKKTRGRNDILSEDDHFVWNGSAYRSLDPVPAALDLKPRSRRR